MAATAPHTFGKREHIVSRKLMEKLFGGGSRSMAAFPLRVVYMTIGRKEEDAPVQVLVSVSKRHFKRAVKRNRVKRQIREAYRMNKQPLIEVMQPTPDRALALAFLWQADELYGSQAVDKAMKSLLVRLRERICRQEEGRK